MNTYISFLRSVNVGGHNIIRMNELSKLLVNAGFINLKTYIQSGNLAFQFATGSLSTVNDILHSTIHEYFKLDIEVVTYSLDKFNQIIRDNPFLSQNGYNTDNIYITFMTSIPDKNYTRLLTDHPDLEDKFCIEDSVIYLFCPNGYGKTRFNNSFFEQKLKVSATTRNFKTITKMAELASDL